MAAVSESPPAAPPAPAAPAELRAALRDLHERRQRRELHEKGYQKALVEQTIGLYRAVVRARLARGEEIIAEHHALRAHLKINQSLLRETDQHAVSLFLTPRRLLRLRSVLRAQQPVSADRADSTVVDELPLDRLRAIKVHRETRPGEALAGLLIVAFAIVFRSWLLVTGKVLIAVGALGMLHALLLPTRWLELEAPGTTGEPFVILAARRKSGRRLVRLLRAGLQRAPRKEKRGGR